MRILLSCVLLFLTCQTYCQSFFALADSVRKARGIPAIGYVVFSDSSIIDMGVTGYRKYRTRDSVRVTDRFHLGTNSFAFTSWMAGKLVEMGKIKWTTTFSSLFPEYKHLLQPQFVNLDLKSLLSNTAGIPPYKTLEDFAAVPPFNSDPQIQRKEFAAWVLRKPGLSDAREKKVAESVAGYTIAVAMMEKATGVSWEKLVDTYLNKPLGIAIKYGWPNAISPDGPWGHWAKYGGISAEPGNTWATQYPATLSVSGISLSIGEYAKFLQDELRGLTGKKSQLKQATLALIHFGIPDYSLGWMNTSAGTFRVATHLGESYLFNSQAELLPEKNFGIVVVCNDGDSMGKGAVINLCRSIREAMLNH